MTEPKQKEGEFDEWLMGDMYDVLKGHTFALEALAELLTSSTLEAFLEKFNNLDLVLLKRGDD
ncbi:MAG: hypothetical protein OEV42_16800 [Deltaproteobacteria bacterium]|nr:hypothetical protein [Deltaproteobacteria bacterium]